MDWCLADGGAAADGGPAHGGAATHGRAAAHGRALADGAETDPVAAENYPESGRHPDQDSPVPAPDKLLATSGGAGNPDQARVSVLSKRTASGSRTLMFSWHKPAR
jgi:hypothetical protein